MNNSIPDGYTRVTEPLKAFSNYESIPPDILKNAADRGTRTHKFCELYVKNIFFIPDEDCKNYFNCFERWYLENVQEVIFMEKRFNHDELLLTGCIDMVAILKNEEKPCLIDIKTTSQPHKNWALQTAAYQMLLKHVDQIDINKRIAVRLPKKGDKAKTIDYLNYENDIRLYLNCLELYRYITPTKSIKKTIPDENIFIQNDFLLDL